MTSLPGVKSHPPLAASCLIAFRYSDSGDNHRFLSRPPSGRQQDTSRRFTKRLGKQFGRDDDTSAESIDILVNRLDFSLSQA